MLADLEPGQLNEWIALARVQPFGDDQLTRLVQRLLYSQKVEADWQDLRQREEYQEPTDAQRNAQLDAMFGRR